MALIYSNIKIGFILSSLYLFTLLISTKNADYYKILFPILISPSLIYLSIVDWKTYKIPDSSIIYLYIVTMLYYGPYDEFLVHIIWALVVTYVLWGIGEIYYMKNNHEGFGIGDSKLFGASVFILGPYQIPALFLISSLGGIVLYGIIKLNLFRDRRRETNLGIPFGPFIAYTTFILTFQESLF